MPDLSLDAVHAFWDSYDRRVLYRVIVALESIEKWAADQDATIDQAICKLGEAMDIANSVDFSGYEEKIINILAYLKSSRAIRILQSIDSLKAGSAAQLLTKAEEMSTAKPGEKVNQVAKLFLDRNLVFERMQLLSRIFSIQRFNLVLNALEKL
jgi:intracellular multiplication protein IcmW